MLSIAQEPPHPVDVQALLQQSDDYMTALYPPESCYPIYADALAGPEVRFFVARLDGEAVGCGALVLGADGAAERKRMFVEASARGRGVGRAILDAIEATARREGGRMLRLGTGVSNREALGLYRIRGYRERGPFGNYRADAFTVFMEKEFGS